MGNTAQWLARIYSVLISHPQIIQELRCRSYAGNEQMISRTSVRDIKQTPLRVVDLFEISVVRDRLDAILQRNDFVIASHHDKRTKLQAFGKMHSADRFKVIFDYSRSEMILEASLKR